MVTQWLNETTLPSNVEVVAVSTSVSDNSDNFPPSEWFADEGFSGTIVADSDQSTLRGAFGTPGFPFWVAVDGDGTVIERFSGSVDAAKLNDLVDKIS